MKKLLLLLILIFTISGCNNSGKEAFGTLEGNMDGSNDDLDPISISAFTPESDPTILTNSTSAVFGVVVTGNVGSVTYDFIKNDSEVILADSPNAFLNILGSSLTPGEHEIKVVAKNGRTEDEKIFNVRKNHPPAVLLSSPASTGTTMNCGSDSKKFTAIINDLDVSDNYLITWSIDGQQINIETPYVTRTDLPNYTEIEYAPDCTQAGTHSIVLKITDGYDNTELNWTFTVNNPPPAPNQVQIVSWIPTQSPVIMTNASDTTFGVSVAEGAGTINYKFYLDNELVQDSGTSFYSLLGNTLMAGFHSLRVVASNGITQAEKSFNLRKNTPPSVSSYTPGLTGNTISCSGGTISLNASIGDVNGDAVTAKWNMDDQLVTGSTAFVNASTTATSASLTYTPDCSDVGFHSFELVLNDGYEDFSQTWTVSVSNPPTPPGNVQILTFTPTSDPTVVTAATTTTFAVSIADGAGPVTYQFKLDNTTVLQNGSTPFLLLEGSNLSAGLHTLRLTATNSVSSDEKTFNIRRNTLPSYIVYSPELTGQTVNCGNNITFDATVIDTDPDTLTKSWLVDNVNINNGSGVTITSTANTAKLVYTTDCDSTGVHTATLRTHDGYESSELTWTYTVTNPAQESLGTTTPSGSNVVALSTETTKTFTAVAASGIPPFTFKWYLKKSGESDQLIKTESNVTSSSLILNSSNDLSFGNQTLTLKLSDSTTNNDPASPVERTWTIYKNQKPLITNVTPATLKRVNSNTSTTLSALITDSNDTFTTTISRGSTLCIPATSCGLSSLTLPTQTGSFSSSFLAGTSFIGDNTFTLSVMDSHGESDSVQFQINANFFNPTCNGLNSGEICTIVGMSGMGDDLDLSAAGNSSKIRITPYKMSMHNIGLAKKNMFITDHINHVIWYWNRNNSTVRLGPYSIPANTVKIILGVAGYNASMTYAAVPNPATFTETTFGVTPLSRLSNFFINGATGITNTVSGNTTTIYFAEYNAQRLLRIVFDNNAQTANIQPSAALSNCYPLDLTVDTNQNKLYIPCTNSAFMRVLSLQNATAPFAFQPTGQATSTTVTNSVNGTYADGAIPATAMTNNLGGATFDAPTGLVYFTEINTCRLRVLNPTENTSTVNLFNGSLYPVTVTPGNIISLSGGWLAATNSWCNPGRLGYFWGPSVTQHGNLRTVLPYRFGGNLLGFFVVDISYHRVVFINQTAQTITIGNRAVAPYSVGIVFGLNNVAGSSNNNGANAGGKSSPLFGPTDIQIDDGVLFVADNSNNRIRSLVIEANSAIVANGAVSTVLGNIPKFGYNESPTLQAELAQLSSPGALKYDEKNNRLLISDRSNRRIRSLNLNTGVVDTIVGNGSNTNQTVQTSPLSAGMLDPWDIEIVKQQGDEYPIYADYPSFIKALNIYGSNAFMFGTEVEPGKLNNIAGTISPPGITNASPGYNVNQWWGNPINDYNTGNLALYNNQPAVVVPINGVRGLGFDENTGNLYVTSYVDHCIHKIDSSGSITVHSGVCTQWNNQSGSFSATRYRYPGDIEMDPLNPGNFFVIDQTDSATASLKYVNTYTGANSSRNILGIPVPGNSIGNITLSTTPNYSTAIAVNESQVCIANGNGNFYASSSVFCYSRSGSGSLSLYVGNRNNPSLGITAFRGKIQKFNEEEGIGMGYFIDGDNIDPINIPAQLSDPQGLAFDSEGNLFISETRGHTIRMVKRWYP